MRGYRREIDSLRAGAVLLGPEFDRVMKAGLVAAQVMEGDGTL